jgi:hypothetical protein
LPDVHLDFKNADADRVFGGTGARASTTRAGSLRVRGSIIMGP